MIRTVLAALAAFIITPTVSLADPMPVSELSAYLNRLKTATASFTQIGPDGRQDSGNFYVQRPYRMRFEYQTQPLLVLASGGEVAVFDGKSNVGAQEYPMSKTPLSLILAPTIDLEAQGVIVAHGEVNGRTVITLKDPRGNTPGNIEISFDPGPVLAGWVATDEMGQRTTVLLEGLRSGVEFRETTFAIESEKNRRDPDR